MRTITLTSTDKLLALDEVERLKWAEALESGKYKQGMGRLFSNGCYCCLGVYESICGVSDELLDNKAFPRDLKSERHHIEGGDYSTVKFCEDDIEVKSNFQANELNDGIIFHGSSNGYTLDFYQIAQLLRGIAVQLRVDSTDYNQE